MKRMIKETFSFCPGCGEDKIYADDHASILCNVCGFHFYVNSSAAVAVLIEDNGGRVLLTKRRKDPAKDMLDLPGGFVDIGETAEQAVTREVKEELNIHIASFKYLFSCPGTYRYDGVTYFVLNLVFLCTVESLDKIKAGDDVSSFCFVEKDKIDLDQIGLESIRWILREYCVKNP